MKPAAVKAEPYAVLWQVFLRQKAVFPVTRSIHGLKRVFTTQKKLVYTKTECVSPYASSHVHIYTQTHTFSA